MARNAAQKAWNNQQQKLRYREKTSEILEQKKQHYNANKHKWRRRQLLVRYGITPDDYQRLLEAQGYVCVICGAEAWECRSGLPCIDHDHETGSVRGLLCGPCNSGLGHFRDQPDLLANAAQYLLDRKM